MPTCNGKPDCAGNGTNLAKLLHRPGNLLQAGAGQAVDRSPLCSVFYAFAFRHSDLDNLSDQATGALRKCEFIPQAAF